MEILYKNFILKNTKAVLLSTLMLISGLSYGSFSGTYSINAGASATSVNYKSFSALFGDMYSGSRSDGGSSNGAGISGAVIINVVSGSGPYTEQVIIYQISGISATNTITINGNGETLQYSASSSSSNATLVLNGADYVTIDNLTVLANGASDGRCIHLYNDARSNKVSNCVLRMPNMTGTSTNNAYIAQTQGTSTITTYGNSGMDNVYTKNKMSSVTSGGPYYGIAIVDESSGTTVRKNEVSSNSINDFRYYGLATYYCFAQTITGNEIFNDATSIYSGSVYGMYNYCYYKGGNYTITDNYIHDINSSTGTYYQYGIYHYPYYAASVAGDIIIERNKIVFKNRAYYSYGLYCYAYNHQISGAFRAVNNYIDIEETTGTYYTYAFYCFGAYYNTAIKSVTIENNYVRVKSTGSAYGLYCYVYYNQNLSKRASISNNIIDLQCNAYAYGIMAYCYSNNMPVDVCFNTIYASGYSTGTISGYKYMMYLYYVDGYIKNNNMLCFDNGGTSYGIYDYYSTGTFSNNNIYNAALGVSFTYGMRNGSTMSSTIKAYRTDFNDLSGMEINPNLRDVPNQNYKPSSFNFVNKGTPVSTVSADFAGVTRNSTNPDVGALEFYVDVAISQFKFTGVNVCGGYREAVTIVAKNNTADTLKNVPVKYTVTGKNSVKGSVPVINPNDSTTYTFTEWAEFNGSGTNTISVELDGNDDNSTNNILSKDVNVTPSPAGFELIESSTFPGYFRPGKTGGSILNPDATIPGLKVIYEVAPYTATGYTNSNYGTKWTISGTSYKTKNGTPVTGPVYAAPSGGNNATLAFDPSSSYTDSLIYLNLFVRNLNTNCDSSFGRWIYIPHIPQTSFDATDVCQGSVTVFTNTTKLLKGTPLYRWKFNNPSDPGDTSTIIDPVYNYNTYGIYMVDLIAYNSAFPKFTVKSSKSVTVTPVPSIDFKVLNACENVPVSFTNKTALPIPGTITYSWDFGDPTTTSDVSTAKEPKWTYKSPGGYKVTLRATANGCASTLVKNANQFATPTAKFTFPSIICDKVDVQFTNGSTIKIGNMGYLWDLGDGGVSTVSNPTHKYSNSSSKDVKLKVISEFGCTDSITKNIVLQESPKADFTWGAACNLATTNFTFTGTRPTSPILTTFNWNLSGEGTSTLENPSKLFSIVGKKMVTLSLLSNNGCSDVITKEVSVKLQSKADFEVSDLCDGDDAVFINKSSVSLGGLNYTWKFGDSKTSNSQSPRHRYNIGGSSQTFNVTLVAIVPGGCSDSITKPVSVNTNPNSGFTFKTSGRRVYFTATQPGATLYQWRFGDGGKSSVSNPQYDYLEYPVAKYYACLAVVNVNGCFSETCKEISITGSVDKISKLTGVKVYPNPNKGNFTVTIEEPKADLSISIYNLLGEVVKTIETNSFKTVYPIDLNVANGVYMVKVTNGGLTSTQKVTVNK